VYRKFNIKIYLENKKVRFRTIQNSQKRPKNTQKVRKRKKRGKVVKKSNIDGVNLIKVHYMHVHK
jgi:hypothetical protein